MRDLINRFKIPVLVVAGLVVIGAVVVLLRGRSSTPTPYETKAYFIDEETGAESVRPMTDIPPLIGAGGKPTVMLARKFSCDQGKTSKVGFLVKYTPEAKAALDAMYASKDQKPAEINIGLHTLVRSPEAGSQWFFLNSDGGSKVTAGMSCPNGQALAMEPK